MSDIDNLKSLHRFLDQSFKGASVGQLKIDDCVASLKNKIDQSETQAALISELVGALEGVFSQIQTGDDSDNSYFVDITAGQVEAINDVITKAKEQMK